MRIDAIRSSVNTNFRADGSKLGKVIESTAATLDTTTSTKRKTISIELHNALVKLTAYRVALLFSVLSGFLGFHAADKMSDNDSKDFAAAVESASIDTTAFSIKDMNHDGSADLILKTTDNETMILDLKNAKILKETTDFKEIE